MDTERGRRVHIFAKRAIYRCISGILAVVLSVSLLNGCTAPSGNDLGYTKYSDSFFESFDTVTTIVAYTKNENEFKLYFDKIRTRFRELHKLYDIYNNYEGINNIKTVNDNAGIAPVMVSDEITSLLEFAMECESLTSGAVNVAMGAVLKVWHDYRERGTDDPQEAELPPFEVLEAAAAHTSIINVVINKGDSTVYLTDPNMSIDLGAVAKGYATELVATEMVNEGMISGIISAGGNIRTIGKPLDGIRERWGVGIQDPDEPVFSDDGNLLDVVYINDGSVVSSGDYERYYTVAGKRYHHIIDPATLMPGSYYRGVTIVTGNSALADALSTAVFLMPFDTGRKFVEELDGVEAMWVMPDGRTYATSGLEKILRSHGASGADRGTSNAEG